jgi:hypothetical protein
MTHVTDDAANHELSMEDLDSVAAGRFSWKVLGATMTSGAVTGFLGGAAIGGIGAGPGALGGGLLTGIGYCIGSLF